MIEQTLVKLPSYIYRIARCSTVIRSIVLVESLKVVRCTILFVR
jgi:hypothetical protein